MGALLSQLFRRQAAPLLLELDLAQPLLEERPATAQARYQARRRLVLPTVVEGLRQAAGDPRVCGVLAKVGARRMGFAQAQELRGAITAFRNSGKPAVAWCETFGEMAAATLPYYLASAFDEIWVQPSGEVGFVGVSVSSVFVAESLEKIGARAQVGARHEYKNAPNMFTERGFTAAHREALEKVVASLAGQVVNGVAEGRRLPVEAVRDLVDRAPLAAEDARQGKLIDKLGYRDQVYASALEPRKGATPQLLFLQRYHRHEPVPKRLVRVVDRHRPVVALVNGVGTIRLGRSGRGPSAAMGSDTVCAALRAAGKDARVRAVVFRVNSPGGSYVASDAIWREVVRLREAGKPVIVSMGDVAASGGYFVSAPADLIVAQPGTITGSIGVFGGKLSAGPLFARLGIGHASVREGLHARMMSAFDEFTEEELQVLSRWLDSVYDDFVAKVAAGRSMPADAVHEVAKGRVWTGADARERGLVDELGGLERAAAVARQRGGLRPDAELVRYPQIPVPARLRPPRSSEDPQAALASLDPWAGLASVALRLGLPAEGPLMMLPQPAAWARGEPALQSLVQRLVQW
ncbi:MAG TPA: signal peptide peptidase SppA [Acidimicrobiales bacterium]|nr:signal peptide peptidase SppA [Acidimicrobiales bacterium]